MKLDVQCVYFHNDDLLMTYKRTSITHGHGVISASASAIFADSAGKYLMPTRSPTLLIT
jgi:hypothetical protein